MRAAGEATRSGWQFEYVNVIGGFLAVTVERRDGIPTLQLRHYSVDGEILNEDIRVLQ